MQQQFHDFQKYPGLVVEKKSLTVVVEKKENFWKMLNSVLATTRSNCVDVSLRVVIINLQLLSKVNNKIYTWIME